MDKKVVLDVCAILEAYGIQRERWDHYIMEYKRAESAACGVPAQPCDTGVPAEDEADAS